MGFTANCGPDGAAKQVIQRKALWAAASPSLLLHHLQYLQGEKDGLEKTLAPWLVSHLA